MTEDQPCPYCAEAIKRSALKCRFCGEFLATEEEPQRLRRRPLQSLIFNRLEMAFVLIQPGSFMMGSPKQESEREGDELAHRVTLNRSYYLQTTPVTQAQWVALMRHNPSAFKGLSHPVENVSWEDCQRFISRLNQSGEGHYRLPTEAEWEYACRAGSKTPFGIGNGQDLDSSQANFDGNYPYGNASAGRYRQGTTPVKSFAPNPWGLYDMHGNVWEWCQDWYAKYPTEPVSDPVGPENGTFRVARGGSWSSAAQNIRSSDRYGQSPDYCSYGAMGFRLCRRV